MALTSRLALALLLAAVVSTSTAAHPDEKDDAVVLWNQAVDAKGGRARLEAVRNIVVTDRTRYPRSPRPDLTTGLTRQRLYVFPTRVWEFLDERPGLFGVSLSIYDLQQAVGWNAAGRIPDRGGIVDDVTYKLLHGQFMYLLETAFLKPEPLSSRSSKVGRVTVDVVETRVSPDVRVEYYLDRRTHLPIQVVVFRTIRIPPDVPLPPQTFASEERYTLGAYANVDGLQMPTVVRLGGGNNPTQTSYRINVTYDEQVFLDPSPSLFQRPALDAWEKK